MTFSTTGAGRAYDESDLRAPRTWHIARRSRSRTRAWCDAEGGGPAEGRVPGDAGARAAQPARADPQRACRSSGCTARPAPDVDRGPREMIERQVRPHGAAGGRPARRVRITRGKIELRTRADRRWRTSIAQRGGDEPPADRRRRPPARRCRCRREPLVRGARPGPAGAGAVATC